MASGSRPSFLAAISRALSVGSPSTFHSPDGSVGGTSFALLQRAPSLSVHCRSGAISDVTSLPSTIARPIVPGPMPDTLTLVPSTHISPTVITPLVIVPVLSVHMTVTLPRVWTAASFFTSTLFLAISTRLTARAVDMVSCSPSGTNATMTPIISSAAPTAFRCRNSVPAAKKARPTAIAITKSYRAVRSISFSRGLADGAASWVSLAI